MIKTSGPQILTWCPVASREAAVVAMVPGILRTNRRNVSGPHCLPKAGSSGGWVRVGGWAAFVHPPAVSVRDNSYFDGVER